MSDIMPPTSPLRIAVIGAGRVGPAVAALLQRAGHVVTGVASRSPEPAAVAAERLGVPLFDIRDGLPDATLVLLAVPDAEIKGVADRIAPSLVAGSVVCHFAGALGLDALASASDTAGLCALHPVQACPNVDLALKRLPGSAWGLTCSQGLEAWAAGLIKRDLRGLPIFVAEEHRAVWHAAAVTTANGITALLASAEAMLRSIGIARTIEVLGPLAAGAIQNAREAGDAAAVLTGPAIRGDAVTLRHHIDSLQQHAPDLRGPYELAARLTLEAARRSGQLEPRAETELANALEPR